MIIRKYMDHDIAHIERINELVALQIRYHQGVNKENIFCALDGDSVAGVGLFIMPRAESKGKQKLELTITACEQYSENQAVDSLLADGLIERFHEVKAANPGLDLCLRVCCETDEISDMQFFLGKGFGFSAVIPVLKYDLTQETQSYDLPAGVSIRKLDFTPEAMKSYIQADYDASDVPDNEADAWFRTGIPTFACYAAMCGEEVVGAISVWNISQERAATENIFVIPRYRRKNIARALIAAAFDELKHRGMKIATLSMLGDNLPAMRLYLSCGYTMYYNLLEMTYE